MKTLITGVQGFTGSSLADQLDPVNGEVYGADLNSGDSRINMTCDLADAEETLAMLDSVRPDQIYHLAGSFTNTYSRDYAGNVLSTRNLLEAITQLGLTPRVLIVGSAAEYGRVSAAQNPIRESQPLRPISVYGLTKAMQTTLMRYYVERYRLDIEMARTFNLFGKGISERLFVGHVYRQVEKLHNQEIACIEVGNLDALRDYIDVAEALAYYRLIMAQGISGEIYNVGSGRAVAVSEVLERILKAENVPPKMVRQVGPVKAAIEDVDAAYADISKLLALAP